MTSLSEPDSVDSQSLNKVDMPRRNALLRFSSAMVAATLGNNVKGANAEETQFSDSPVSDRSVARSETYDDDEKEEESPVAASSSDNSPSSEVSPPKASAKEETAASLTPFEAPELDSTGLIALVGVGGFAVYAASVLGDGNDGEQSSTAAAPAVKTPDPLPYGLQKGRNFYEGVDVSKKAADGAKPPPVAASPPLAPAATAAEPKKEETPPKKEEEKPKWTYQAPTPYGILNKNKNPYLKQIEEFCDAGEVKEECTESIKGYLDSLSNGNRPTKEATKTIITYLDSLSSNQPPAGKSKAGAAFSTYLDALSTGAAPPPSSAKAVSGYLESLSGVTPKAQPSKPRPAVAVPPLVAPKASPPPEVATPPKDNFDARLTSVETRVTRLEEKVDQIPGQVFNKMEQWQAQQDSKLSAEVKKIVEALSSEKVMRP